MSNLIAPSILAADFANLQRDIEMINKSDDYSLLAVQGPTSVEAMQSLSNWLPKN